MPLGTVRDGIDSEMMNSFFLNPALDRNRFTTPEEIRKASFSQPAGWHSVFRTHPGISYLLPQDF